MQVRRIGAVAGWLAMWLVVAVATAATPPASGPAGKDTAQIDVEVADDSFVVPEDFTVRVRLTKITPAEPTAIAWRRMGEGLGGAVIRGAFCEDKLPVGEWTQPMRVRTLAGKGGFPGKMFLTVTAGRGGDGTTRDGKRVKSGFSTDVEFEFEFSLAGKVVKTFRQAGPDGGTVNIVIPAYRLTAGKTPADAAFLAELTGILEYATARADWLEKLPWAKLPLPRKFGIVNNLGGYGEGTGYGVRYTDRAVIAAECRAVRQLGVNGFWAAPPFLWDMIARGEGFAKDFGRVATQQAGGYPVPTWRKGSAPDPTAGCPFAPGVAQRTEENNRRAMDLLKLPVEEVWGVTVDEIGSVFDNAQEGKGHVAVCPHCAEGFRKFCQAEGLKPEDFGKQAWSDVRPSAVWQVRSAVDAKKPAAPKPPAMPAAPGDPAPSVAPMAPTPVPASAPASAPAGPDLTDPQQALLAYYTARFANDASAGLFAPLRQACDAANDAKRKALASAAAGGAGPAGGAAASSVARQPWLYSYALRGNTFLMGGHSLDFFDFYRHADNAFVYETSNRGTQVWGWDSYLCDVGRAVAGRMGKHFGIYIKPHRGAPVQRMLAAVGRGVEMIYWYTYGPDYSKGDSFSQDPAALELTSKATHLLGAAEDVLWGARWAQPAEVAIVKPWSSEIWLRLAGGPARQAAWENAKWTYTALQHAHVPVDAVDEKILAAEDLSRYKVIYVGGTNLTHAAAAGLARWVQAGGTLYLGGWSAAMDEGNQPLKELLPVLGLKARSQPEMYCQVAVYGATGLESFDEPARRLAPVPAGAKAVGAAGAAAGGEPAGAFVGEIAPVIGREVLQPAGGAQVLARFADGSPAVTCNAAGKGKAYVVGLFAGLEYSAGVRGERFDMSRDFPAVARAWVAAAALERVRPVVDASAPAVEGVLLVNPATGRRAVTLANWAYRVVGLRKKGAGTAPVFGIAPAEGLKVTIRAAGAVKKVTSALQGAELKFAPAPAAAGADAIVVELPRLDEGDVLLIE